VEALSALSVAVVGTRRASGYALRVTDRLVDGLAEGGLAIVSGMARGIDEAAHRRALLRGATTVAVLGCGADVCYPPESRALKRSIEECGAVVSQFAPGEPPLPTHFPARNRVVTGLSRAVIVVEAAARSGAMISALSAVEQERPLFAVPGSILTPGAAGCNQLLSEGTASLVRDASDVLAEIGIRPQGLAKAGGPPADPATCAVMDALHRDEGLGSGGWLEAEEIAVRSGMPLHAVLRLLVRLELEGLVARAPGNRYRAG
jgi:DNA processing protein